MDIEVAYQRFKAELEAGWSIEVARARAKISHHYFKQFRNDKRFFNLIVTHRKFKGTPTLHPCWKDYKT